LIHAAFDWGNGDWETALGAAAHSGGGILWSFCMARVPAWIYRGGVFGQDALGEGDAQ